SLHVAEACKPDQLLSLLERTVQKLKPRPGNPVVKPATQSPAPKHGPDTLVLHLTARVLQPGSGWDGFPVENWIVLNRRQWTGFLDFEPGKNTIRSLRLVTYEAKYARGTFGVAVRSVP